MSGADLELPETMHIEGEQPDEQPSGERKLTPREVIMNTIAARAEAQRDQELAQSAIYDADAREAGLAFPVDEPEPQSVAQPHSEVGQASVVEREAPPVAQPTAAPAPDRPAVRSVVMDGQRFDVTDAQADELIRLGMAANVALHQYQQPAPHLQPAPPQRQLVDPDLVRETVKQIQYGGEEAGAEALTKLVLHVAGNVPQAPQIDPNAIVHQAVTAARAHSQLERDTAVVQNEYADIFEHPQRVFLAKANVEAIRARNVATGRQQSDLDIYREAGNMVRDAMSLPRPGSEAVPSTALQAASAPIRQDVIERKRAAPRATQAIDLRAPTPQTPRPPTGSEIVDRIRQQRGQASMR